MTGKESEKRQKLKRRELYALLLMAEQNVQILREDIDEVIDRIEGIRVRYGVGRDDSVSANVTLPVDGIWREV